MLFVRRHLILVAALAVGACAYDPPLKADHDSAKYKSDLAKCQKQAAKTAAYTSGATPQAAIGSLFTSSEPEHKEIRTCMQGRGYTMAP
jgi:hypothetical protein